MARFIPGVTRRNPTATIERDLAKAKAEPPRPIAPVVAEQIIPGASLVHIGQDSESSGRAVVPVRAASSAEWEAQALADTAEARDAANRALYLEHLLREAEERPRRVEARERLLAERKALADLTGVPFVPDRSTEQRFQMARFFDSFSLAEVERDPKRESYLRAIVTDAERILNEQFLYDIRRIQARVIERFKA